jgi:hypothetical protein
MNRLTTRIFTWSACCLLTVSAFAAKPPGKEEEGPYVRVMMNEDGSRTVFRKSPDNRTLIKKTYSGNGVLRLKTIYRMDAYGNPRSCKIYDGKGIELFKVRYGYDRRWGRLVEEQMFDSRVKRINPDTGGEMPVRRFIYTYDAQGNRSQPLAITLKPGKTAESLYGAQPSALEHNPFDDEKPAKRANPRAHPVGGKH